mgnify:FL=1|tara:strand:+ start:4707 stop:5315 length:609 start_codon:yes stop_codon:yes gene_type:complete
MKNATFLFLLFSSFFLSAQQMMINGTVKDSDGFPLPGATVLIKGTSNGTQTDFDGNYSIMAYKGAKLVYNYIGYKTKEIEIQDLAIIHVSLEEDYEALEEIVVMGYGIGSSTYAVGSVSRLNKRESQKNNLQLSISRQLQGKVRGVVIDKRNNETKVERPLYIVDGIPIQKEYNTIVESLNNDDIAEKKYLKEAKLKIYTAM